MTVGLVRNAEGTGGVRCMGTRYDLVKHRLQMEREVVADYQLVPALDTSQNCR